MRRLIALILVCCFVLLGTGAVQYFHQLQHQAEAKACYQSSTPHDHQPAKHHDSSCQLCLQLHHPIFIAGWSADLVGLATVTGWVTVRPDSAITSLPLLQVVCRGPPPTERSA